MTTQIKKSPKTAMLGLVAALALMVGLAGAGLAANDSANAQSPTSTATTTRTATSPASPPATGSGIVSSEGGSSLALPIAALAVIMIGGGIAFAVASRNQD